MDETEKRRSFADNKKAVEDKEFDETIRNREIELLKTRVKILEDAEAIWKRERAALVESEAFWKDKFTVLKQGFKNQEEKPNFPIDSKELLEFLESVRGAKRTHAT